MAQLDHIAPGPDTLRLLLTTDNHVGYMESDPIRGDDSWQTFQEILQIGQDNDIDMIIQGGDLFHINNPSKKSYYHVMRLLRQYCYNGKPLEYKLLSDPGNSISTKHFDFPIEYDPNMNVGMPVYAICGNHDDATGEAMLSPLDLLGVSGLLNHFGKVDDNENISIHPLLFNKGDTNLALYGMPSIREERLLKTMASGGLEFMEPDSEDRWFNLMCLHQNHVRRPGVKVLEENSLPSFLDFVLWGHEHESVNLYQNDITGTHILQAGSSIATSLSMGETGPKQVFILSIKGEDFSIETIRLKSVRPFIMKEISLKDHSRIAPSSSNKEEVLNFLMLQVELMITMANDTWRRQNRDLLNDNILTENDMPLPLIRLKVDYSGGYEVENPRFFSNRFVGKVANVNDVVIYHKRDKRAELVKLRVSGNEDTQEDSSLVIPENDTSVDESSSIINIVKDQLRDEDLIMLDKSKFADTLQRYLSSESKEILPAFLASEQEEYTELMSQLAISGDDSMGEPDVNVRGKFRELVKEVKSEIQRQDTQLRGESKPKKVPSNPVMTYSKTNKKKPLLATTTPSPSPVVAIDETPEKQEVVELEHEALSSSGSIVELERPPQAEPPLEREVQRENKPKKKSMNALFRKR